MAPVEDNACKIPTIAEELCTITVRIRPVKIPITGISLKYDKTLANAGDEDNGSTASVIDIRPMKRIPKPIAIIPGVFNDSFFTNMIKMIPKISATGAKKSGLKNARIEPLPDSISIKRIICAVTVVPMLAPITILTACFKFKIPAPIKPTVNTIVAVEL